MSQEVAERGEIGTDFSEHCGNAGVDYGLSACLGFLDARCYYRDKQLTPGISKQKITVHTMRELFGFPSATELRVSTRRSLRVSLENFRYHNIFV